MIPLLAWIANSAPAHLKATFFAAMASFTSLGLSLGSLATKYLNRIFQVSREVVEPLSGHPVIHADYSELGILLVTVSRLGLVLPIISILLVRCLLLHPKEADLGKTLSQPCS